MPRITPQAHGPDIAGSYQRLTGHPIDPTWTLFSHKAAEGERTHDRSWRERWPWMHTQQQLRYRGLYHWLRSDSTPAAQADHALRIMHEAEFGQAGDIWQVDWEVTPNIPLMTSTQVREYCDRIRQARGEDRIIMYSSDWLPDSTLDNDSRREFHEWRDENPDDALWFANYNTDPANPFGGWAETEQYDATVWQFTSKATHPSIVSSSAGFDMNHIINHRRLDEIAGYTSEWSIPMTALHLYEVPDPRLIDTRPGPKHHGHLGHPTRDVRVVSDSSFAIPIPAVQGHAGTAAVIQVTSTRAAGPGFMVFYGAVTPSSSHLNYSELDTSPQCNMMLVPIDNSGDQPVVRGVARHSDVHLMVDLIAVIT